MIWKWIPFDHHVHPFACNPIKTYSIFKMKLEGALLRIFIPSLLRGHFEKCHACLFLWDIMGTTRKNGKNKLE
jgi:hypothetical protein